VGLGHLLAFPLELRPFDPLREVQIEPPHLLTFVLCPDVTQRLTSCWQALGQPCAPLGSFQCMGDEGRRPSHAAEVLPDALVQGERGRIARRAALAPGCAPRSRAPLPDVIVRAGGERPTRTRQPTWSPAHEATE